MLNLKKLLLLVLASATQVLSIAQSTADGTEINKGTMASEGKIYVVMAVVITILLGLIFYVARLDRKISKLEKGESL